MYKDQISEVLYKPPPIPPKKKKKSGNPGANKF